MRESRERQHHRRWGDNFQGEPEGGLGSDSGRGVGIHHNTTQRDGKQLDTYCCIVFELKNGRIVDGREHFFDLYNWDEFWR